MNPQMLGLPASVRSDSRFLPMPDARVLLTPQQVAAMRRKWAGAR